MGEILTEFVKHAGFFTVLRFFITPVLILIGIAFFIFGQSKTEMCWFLGKLGFCLFFLAY
jgi:hypothetical protein